ncbi:PPE domain-containing protein [Mycobacterium sp.]|uniref:PPE family protein n=1 Tax=Mycobacterium sp. TaxID=1785 RepID=UPI003A86114A
MAGFVSLPPEINSLRMLLGAGSAPMLAAAAAWNNLAEELGSAAGSFSSVTSNLTGQAWQGPAATAMAQAAAPYSAFLEAASARALIASSQANAVAGAFETARAAMINPEAIAANRNAFAQLVRSNFLGLNGPMIAAAEGAYEEFWAADVTAMFGYHGGASAAAAQLSSWQQALGGLPGVGGLFGRGAAGSAAAGEPNLGVGNNGGGNIGNGNNSGTGGGNIGNGNFGSGNLGGGNIGIKNFGSGNFGEWNFGLGNRGFENIGFGNTGDNNILGFGNHGDYNAGIGNHGTGNQGFGNTGDNNIGFGLTGNNLIGVGGAYYDTLTGTFHFDGNTGTGNLGLFNSGTGNIGFFNSGDGNLGFFNSGANIDPSLTGLVQTVGIGNSGYGNVGLLNSAPNEVLSPAGDSPVLGGNFGIGNSGSMNTGLGNAGDYNTGFGNAGSYNTGNHNSGYTNTFSGNSGDINTGFFNSGHLNTGFGSITDAEGPNSGFNNTGNGVSGFNNTTADPHPLISGRNHVSGFFNEALGGEFANGRMSGWFNTGVPIHNSIGGDLTISGFTSGYFNYGSLISGLFGLG